MSTIKTNQLAHTANGASVYTLPQTDGSAGQVLKTDGSGNLSWVSLPAATDPGLAMANQWRMSSNQTIPYNSYDLIGNWEEVDTHTSAKIGSSMTESSAYFSFPSTGIYQITFAASLGTTSGSVYTIIRPVTGGSFPSISSETEFSAKGYGAGGTIVTSTIFDVTDISTHKVAFYVYQAINTGGITIRGNSSTNLTTATFLKLGPT
jgi:hypothetical protein